MPAGNPAVRWCARTEADAGLGSTCCTRRSPAHNRDGSEVRLANGCVLAILGPRRRMVRQDFADSGLTLAWTGPLRYNGCQASLIARRR